MPIVPSRLSFLTAPISIYNEVNVEANREISSPESELVRYFTFSGHSKWLLHQL